VELQDRLLRIQVELERRATHDVLTGVRNRASLLEILARELKRTQRTKSHTGIVILDIDHFKTINDTKGHPVGDEVLVEFAARCQRSIREYDVFGRYGGEEFLLIVPAGNLPDASVVASRLLANVSKHPFTTSAGSVSVTASAGVASTGQGYLDSDALIAAADVALYQAKRAGRACFRIASEAGLAPSGIFDDDEPGTLPAKAD
jgi:two-component system, cell cycle response regulator